MDPITISLSPQQATLALIVVLTALVFGILMLMGRKGAAAPATGWLIPTAQALSIVMFGFAIIAASYMLWSVIAPPAEPAAPAPGLGAGAVIVALLGAPFLIWRTVIAQKTVDFQKEGHITDRIAKAVEQLGAEKKVDRIGRPLTLFSGQPTRETRFFPDGEPETLPPHSVQVSRQHTQQLVTRGVTSTMMQGVEVTFDRWSEARTVIEWQGKPPPVAEGEHIAHTGEWQTFSESLPNIEVRIGGILSLERIAQDSTAYDQGRDHVPIMRILCAYIRENAPAGGIITGTANSKLFPAHRQDIALALTVIGRRSPRQLQAEARSGNIEAAAAKWIFDTPPPAFPPIEPAVQFRMTEPFLSYFRELDVWQRRHIDYKGYRLDLRDCDLRGANLVGLNLSGAFLARTKLSWANLNRIRLTGAILFNSECESTFFGRANLSGANLQNADMRKANLTQAELHAACLRLANLEGAVLHSALLYGAEIRGTGMDSQTSTADMVLIGAGIRQVDYTDVKLTEQHLSQSFGDASVILPGGRRAETDDWPRHWPRWQIQERRPELGKVEADAFRQHWYRWQTDPTYTPPPPPD